MNQRGFTPILIILLIATVIGGYLIYSGKITLPLKTTTPQASSETTNWKTFNSELQGIKYSINYPQEYKTYNNPENNQDLDQISNMRSIQGNFQNGDISVSILASKSNNFDTNTSGSVGRVSSIKTINKPTTVYFQLVCDYYPSSDINLKDKCNQILSTFKFTN